MAQQLEVRADATSGPWQDPGRPGRRRGPGAVGVPFPGRGGDEGAYGAAMMFLISSFVLD